ncbi:stage III sporulation protein SpoAB [Clostridiales bacterium CHKCI001]|nr:stage III sporulation protein SpoAB [Clostridiales bacterium CHKCI001]
MILEIIGSSFVVAGTSFLGFWWAANYKKRMEELGQIEHLMHMLYGEIKYKEGNFSESFQSIGTHCRGRIQTFSIELSNALNEGSGHPFFVIWANMIKRYWENSALTEEDKAIFISVGEKMGYLDKEMQLNTIQLFLTQIEQRQEILRKMLPEKCRISRLIGVLSGIFIVILLL